MDNLPFLFIFLPFLFAWYLNFHATRLDRLHHRVETSWANLDSILQRRAALASQIAHLPDIDFASNLILTSAATQARSADIADRSEAESGLSEALRLLRDEFPHRYPEIFAEMDEINGRLKTAIALHREAVYSTILRRRYWVNRFFRLAGKAPLPITYPFEDDLL